ncbi:MAG: DUF835 domain-containing protein [Candidatus Thermoplasmatota archaeon]|nr:DUF835 domain-containing protein [Candidatus Thermoplasmatota archaeon]
MSSKIDLPEGLKAQEIEGRGSLQPLLKKLKKYSFQGYVKIEVPDEYEGVVVLKDGVPRNAVLYFLSDDESRKGLPALQRLQTLDTYENLQISVHTDLDVEKLMEEIDGELSSGGERKKSSSAAQGQKGLLQIIEESDESVDIEEGEIPEGVDERFPERYSFNDFIVGPNNRFAYAAALSVAENPGESYNPLFITSRTGLGKTHLLKAIGRAYLVNYDDRRVKYVVTSQLLTEIEEHRKKNEMAELRKKYTGLDTLLLEDIQSLADKPQMQEEVFYIFSELQEEGRQIVLSSDRSPEKIPEIEDKLISRFKSGLVVDILSPHYETRKKIIESKVEKLEEDIPEEVVDYLAREIKKNVRFIEGGLNRLSAYSSLLDESITLETVKDVLSRYLDKEAETEGLKPKFMPGRSYIIEEETGSSEGFKLINDISPDKKKYILSRMNPKRIEEDYHLSNSEILWLTDKNSDKEETIPPNLERLSWSLEEKVKEKDVVLIDGLEYLISNTSFDATIQFIRHLVDVVSETETIFLVIVNPMALESKQINILEREMDSISYVS